MGGQATALAESIIDWWSLAGVDALVGEAPAGWLNAAPVSPQIDAPEPAVDTRVLPAEKPAPRRADVPTAPAMPAPADMPGELGAFRDWLASGSDVPGSQWDTARVLPEGPANAPTMLLAAWPEIDDLRDGQMFAGAAAPLLAAMLRAVGLTRDACYIAPLAVTRPPGGRCSTDEAAALQRLLWHHLRLAAPQRLIVFGSDMLRLATGGTLAEARGKLLDINQDGIKMVAIAAPHPTTLLARPAQKAAAWDSLKLLNQGI